MRTLRHVLPDEWLRPDQRWNIAQQWISTCVESHGHSCQRESDPTFPTRILDLDVADIYGKRGTQTRILTSDITSTLTGRYACLSHSWGGKMAIMLNATTQEQLTSPYGVAIANLPKTFRDAIAVCLALDIRYLWIDSLCIKQDCPEDWQVEAAKMATYYGQCYVCIAATQSANANQGFTFKHRPTTCIVAGHGPDDLPYRLSAYPQDSVADFIALSHNITQPRSQSVADALPLLSRAWVFQERRLSPRVIHMCHEEVVFECDELTTCECGRAQTSDQSSWTKNVELSRRSRQAENPWLPSSDSALRRENNRQWHNVIVAYMALNLTFTTDRLPAFAGIARTTIEPTKYLAGIRKDEYAQDMSWYVTPKLVPSARLASYTAPSWSWASLGAEVKFANPGSTEFTPGFSAFIDRGRFVERSFAVAFLTDSNIELRAHDPFMQVGPDTSVTFRCKLLRSSWRTKAYINENDTDLNWNEYSLSDTQAVQTDHAIGGTLFAQDTSDVIKGWDIQGDIRFYPDYRLELDSDAGKQQQALYLMPLFVKMLEPGERHSGAQSHELLRYMAITALVLRKCAGQTDLCERSSFERVGLTEYLLDRTQPWPKSEEDMLAALYPEITIQDIVLV